jgi:L-arabinose isomerase
VRLGLFSIGLDVYWPQFEGLRERLLGYNQAVARRLERPGVEIVNLGLIDNPQAAAEAGHQFRRADVDVVFLHVATYALSSTVLPVVRRAKVPVVILNLSPGEAIDYAAFNRMGDRGRMTGEWLAWCQACPVPEIANVFQRARIPYFEVTGMLERDPDAWKEIGEWVDAARVASAMEHNRLGLMGHYYGGMLDIYSDLTMFSTCSRIAPRPNWRARRELRWRSTAWWPATPWDRWRITIRAPAMPPTKMPSAASLWAPAI